MNERPGTTRAAAALAEAPAKTAPQPAGRTGAGHGVPTYRPDVPFLIALGLIALVYVALIAGMLASLVFYVELPVVGEVFTNPRYRYAVLLSLTSCSITAVLSVWVAVPTAYLLTRVEFPGKRLLDAVLDIPIVLPPLVIGLALLMLFQTAPGRFVQGYVRFTYAVPGVVLAQFMVACAFAIRTMTAAFAEINPRQEQVAMTLGCSRAQAFWWVVLPEAQRGMVPAATIAWARAMGEFGPVLVFAGTTAFRTEVMPTSIFLELQVGNLGVAAGISIVMVTLAMAVLLLMRMARGRISV
ncbi:MAG: ABC transporter permease [Thermoguttaceae bacterium]|nr:ABC transporter permease [Thermoguttaceae bacterium]